MIREALKRAGKSFSAQAVVKELEEAGVKVTRQAVYTVRHQQKKAKKSAAKKARRPKKVAVSKRRMKPKARRMAAKRKKAKSPLSLTHAFVLAVGGFAAARAALSDLEGVQV